MSFTSCAGKGTVVGGLPVGCPSQGRFTEHEAGRLHSLTRRAAEAVASPLVACRLFRDVRLRSGGAG